MKKFIVRSMDKTYNVKTLEFEDYEDAQNNYRIKLRDPRILKCEIEMLTIIKLHEK